MGGHREAVEQERLHTPDVAAPIRPVPGRDGTGLDGPWPREGLDTVLRSHVRGFFRQLAGG